MGALFTVEWCTVLSLRYKKGVCIVNQLETYNEVLDYWRTEGTGSCKVADIISPMFRQDTDRF